MGTNVHYVACWTEDDGIHSCEHEHSSVRDAMDCLVPDGAGFIRAHEAGRCRSLTEAEFIAFLEALPGMPWSSANRG